MATIHRQREALYALADYYAWSARKGFATDGNDPRDGRPWRSWDPLARAIGRAENAAAARVVYAVARRFPSPLP